MIRAAIYARVSSQAQRERHTIENQLRVLRPFVVAQGWALAGEYIDDGRSAKAGKLEARDGFARLLADVGVGKVDVLVVVDVDRLTRTDDMTERAAILGPFQRANVRIVTPSGGELDMRTMLGELYVTLQAIVAAEENRKRAQRIIAGKLRAIAEGRKPAGPTPFGLAYDRASARWSIEEVAAAIVREIYARCIAGESTQAIAIDFHARGVRSPRGPWDRQKVWHLLRSRHTVGEWIADKHRRLTITVPAILDEATWAAAQDQLLSAGKRGLRRTKHTYLLEGICVCELCGSPVAIRSAPAVGTPAKTGLAAYLCRSRKLDRIGEARCPAPIVHVRDVDDRVWRAIARELADPALPAELAARADREQQEVATWAADARGHRAHLDRLARVEASHLARFRRGMVTDEALEVELAALRRERAAVARQLATAERAAAGSGKAVVTTIEAAGEALARLAGTDDRTVQQRLVRALVDRGGATLRADGRIALTLTIPEAGAASLGAPAVSAPHAGYRTRREDIGVTIRVVA